MLGSLGSILSKSSSVGDVPTAEPGGGNTQLAAALTSDFSDADLPACTKVATLGQQLTAPTVDIDQVADTARSIANTLAPLTDLLSSGAASPAANGQLAAAPVGTAEHNASEVLTRAGQSDLESAFSAALKIADTASTLTGDASAGLPSSAPEIQTLADDANLLTGQVAPLVSTPPVDALSSAPVCCRCSNRPWWSTRSSTSLPA